MASRDRNSLPRRFGTAAAIVGALTLPLGAHDLWIEPSTFSPAPGQIIGVRLRVGQDFIGDPVPRDPALVEQFVIEDGARRRPLIGRAGADPAGLVRIETSGTHVIGYASRPSALEVPAATFNAYLAEEGLETIAALREARGQTQSPGRELFTRCAKSLVAAASPGARGDGGDRRLGFTLELIAERNPYGMRAGEGLPVRLTYQDKPLAGALVVAINRGQPSAKQAARTDGSGRVHLRLAAPGEWLVKAVHMVPAAGGSNADWASFWASLTFDLPSVPGPAAR